ncbi:nuclear transport factor 2 family protein [Chondromyces apiculatus]|uniref:DUF4440 domain-containing protein n=1 Tax=Chondromyces apiculatus DSM 436 TaxID=1192034 RepID=A0A017T7U5_9BACT|nr:nuclear transport factor 2 family protein [Chondromyces apiculatus]EYF04880.1 Hypothetical protein CAP_3906 [Chondromyces apiculatus DSM 436]
MKTSRIAGWLLSSTTFALVACSESPPTPTGAAPSATVSASPVASGNPHPTPPPSTTDEARALLDKWVAAQKEGKADAYAALYAPKFEGVLRAGARVHRLDRARWLKQQEAALQKKPEVKVSDVSVIPSLAGATVLFTQTGAVPAEGAEAEAGVKRLSLVRADGKLLIEKEEMLRPAKPKGDQAAPAPTERFAFVVRTPTPMVVLDTNPKEEWTDGPPSLTTRGDVVLTSRMVDATKLPENLASFRGKRFELHGKTGKVCEATVTSFGAVGRVTPAATTVARWDAKGEGAVASLNTMDIARDAWDLSASGGDTGGRLLVAQIFPVQGTCDEALWGRVIPEPAAPEAPKTDAAQKADTAPKTGAAPKPAESTKPGDTKAKESSAKPGPGVPAEARPADDATRDKVLEAFRKLPAYEAIQKEYGTAKAAGDPEHWEEFQGGKPEVFVMELPGGLTLIAANLSAGAACGGFGAALSAIWESKGGKLTLVREPEGETLRPWVADDVDGDGKFEILLEEGVLLTSGTRYDRWNRLAIPALGSGC